MSVAIRVVVVVFVALCNVVLYLLNENSILKNWWERRKRLLATTNRLLSNTRPSSYWAWNVLDPNHAVQGVGPKWVLLTYRIATFSLFTFTIIYQGLVSGYSKPHFTWLIYFTNWTFVGFGLTSVLGLSVLIQDLYHPQPPDKQQWTPLRKAYMLVYVVVTSCAFFLTIFYWTVDYEEGDDITPDNVIRHGVNVVFLMGDVLLSRLPFVTYHFQTCLLYGTVYLVFMWIYQGFSGDWVYDSLDWNDTSSLIYYGILPLLMMFGFGSMYGLATLRERVLVPRTGMKTYTSMETGEIQLGEVAVISKDDGNLNL